MAPFIGNVYSVWNGNQLSDIDVVCAMEYCCHFNNRSSRIRQLILRICPLFYIIIGIFFPVSILSIESCSNGIQTQQISTQWTEQIELDRVSNLFLNLIEFIIYEFQTPFILIF